MFAFLLGRVSCDSRAFEVPGPTDFWRIITQPVATLLAASGVLGAAVIAYRSAQANRKQDAKQHEREIALERESRLHDRGVMVRLRYLETFHG